MADEPTQAEEILGLVHDIATEVKEKGLESGEQMEKLEKMVEDLSDQQAEIRAELAKSEAEREAEEAATHGATWTPEIKSGKYEGMKSSDLFIAANMLKGVADRQGRDPRSMMSEEMVKAMDSTTDTAGDDWVPTGMSNQLYSNWEKQTKVYSLFPNVTMPTNPYVLPIATADQTVYLNATENSATTASNPTTDQLILTAGKLMAETDYSYELDEDSAVAIAPIVSDRINRAMAAAMDSVIINGDTTTTSANISYLGTGAQSGAQTATQKFLIFDGLRHQGLVDNTGCKADISGLAIGDFGTLMGKMGKYATSPNDCAWIMDVWSYLKAIQLSDFITVDKYGPSATLLSGELGKVYGWPVIVSEEVSLGKSTGTVAQTAGDNTLGTIIGVHRPSWVVGSKRSVGIETDRVITTQQQRVVISTRMALMDFGTSSTATHTAVGYDVVVS